MNIIIGKNSSLTRSLSREIKKPIILSANSSNLVSELKKYKNKKINLIINNFYPAYKINTISNKDYEKFNKLSLKVIFDIFANLKPKNINKIIYTSSSSVFIIPQNINNFSNDIFNRNLQGSFKIAAEALVSNFSSKNNIKCYIMRVFNTFGDPNCKFSFVEKLIQLKQKNKKVRLINGGNSVRDFIHVKDVAKIYKYFLKNNIKSNYFDIGTGNGCYIKDLVKLLNFKNNKIINLNNIHEREHSIANNLRLVKILKNFKFVNVEKYIKSKINFKSKNKILFVKDNNFTDFKPSGHIIYGAGFAGKVILKELKRSNEDVLYLIDDNIRLKNTSVNGIPIINFSDLIKLKDKINVRRVYVCIPSFEKNKLESLINRLKKHFFDVRYLPQKKYLISDKLDLNDFKINEINQILKRKQHEQRLIKNINKKNVLVTGGGGSIGSEICRQLCIQNVKKLICLDQSELAIYNLKKKLGSKSTFVLGDMGDENLVRTIIKKYKINLVIHAGAYKHVNILEENIFSAVKNNIFATAILSSISLENKCDFLLVSTDKAAQPKSILGYTKRLAEMYCEYLNTFNNNKSYINIVRFGNVFGSSGSAVNNFLDQINNNQVITVTNKKATRYFMTIIEACFLVLQTTNSKFKNKTFVLNMGTPINIYKLAEYFAKLKSKINPTYKYKIIETGLNAGEKMHEKLFSTNEKVLYSDTYLKVIKNKKIHNVLFEKKYNDLVSAYIKNDKQKLLRILKRF